MVRHSDQRVNVARIGTLPPHLFQFLVSQFRLAFLFRVFSRCGPFPSPTRSDLPLRAWRSDYQGPRFAVDEFKISRTNEKIKNKMTLAKMLPFTNGPNEEPALTRALLG